MTRVVSVARTKGSTALGALGAALISLGLLGVTGCPGTLDPSIVGAGGGGSSGGGTCDIQPLMTDKKYNCAVAGCHDAMGTGAGLDLASPMPETRLIGKMPKGTNGSMCGAANMPYLMAGSSPATGLFLLKLTPQKPCGAQMPTIGGPVSAADLDCFQKWANTMVMAAGGGTGTGGTGASDAGGQ